MDKTLEIVMVAVALILAVVVVTSMMQSQSEGFGEFADNQTSSASCGVAKSQYCSAFDGDSSSGTRAGEIADNNDECGWSSGTGTGDIC